MDGWNTTFLFGFRPIFRGEVMLMSEKVLVHQTFQVPKMEVLTYISCMDTAYVRESPSPK